MLKLSFIFCFFTIYIQYCISFDVKLLMPNVVPKQKDTYFCSKFKLDEKKSIYITEFQPQSNKEIAHHILLFGCEEPGSENDVWNCGEMNNGLYNNSPVCQGGKQSIIYAWAMDAPSLSLPKDVAFKVGGNTKIKYLVLQVHYSNIEKFTNGNTDNSGIIYVGQYKPTQKIAGTYLLATNGVIKSKSIEYFEAACELKENIEIHPFAFRTHAHKLGIVNSGYVVKFDKISGKQNWIEIGRRSPQLPQMFFPVKNQIQVKKGDVLAARCTMINQRNHDVYIGSKSDNEMCNFYIMYYVDGEKNLDTNVCFTAGPPNWYFNNFHSNGKLLKNSAIPFDASSVPSNPAEEMPNMQFENLKNEESTINEEDLIDYLQNY